MGSDWNVTDWELKVHSVEQHIRVLQNDLKNKPTPARKETLKRELEAAKRELKYNKERLSAAKKEAKKRK